MIAGMPQLKNNCIIGDRTKIKTGVYIVTGSVLRKMSSRSMVTTTNDNLRRRTEGVSNTGKVSKKRRTNCR